MTAIMASTVQVKTMADDTLRLTIDIDPQYAHEAFALFGKRGSPCAIARLTNEAAVEEMREEVTSASNHADVPKGGPLAKLAGMWCNDPRFWAWVEKAYGDKCDCPEAAAEWVRFVCHVGSRAELDVHKAHGDRFHRVVREPFAEYLRGLE